MRPRCLTVILIAGLVAAPDSFAGEIPDEDTLVAEGAVIGEVVVEPQDVFDLSDPEENKWLYRWANRLHLVTRAKVVRKQLLIASGDDYSKRLSDESARILRTNRYLYDANIVPINYENGVVDVKVTTRDVWSLHPDISGSRAGGKNKTEIGLTENNLLGSGIRISAASRKDVDRESKTFEISDRHVGKSWVSALLGVSRNSDGHSNLLSVARPFYELDARWTAGTRLADIDRRETLYELGEEAAEYQKKRDTYSAFYGWSRGLREGQARRWKVGLAYDENQFSPVANGTLPAVIPSDRKLVYPFLGFELVEDDFETAKNRNQIGRTEDFMMGRNVVASLGWSDESFGADRDALIFSGRVTQSFRTAAKNTLQLSASAEGRVESGKAVNSLAHLYGRFYRRQSEKHLFFASVSGTAGHTLDLDNPVQLGGDSGLRGYPIRYQNGDSKVLATIEHRYFTDWYPFRLFRVGAAIFADVGRVWGESPVGEERLDWLADAGFGLRLGLTRVASGRVVHVDVAFPLNGDESIDSVQLLVKVRRSF